MQGRCKNCKRSNYVQCTYNKCGLSGTLEKMKHKSRHQHIKMQLDLTQHCAQTSTLTECGHMQVSTLNALNRSITTGNLQHFNVCVLSKCYRCFFITLLSMYFCICALRSLGHSQYKMSNITFAVTPLWHTCRVRRRGKQAVPTQPKLPDLSASSSLVGRSYNTE